MRESVVAKVRQKGSRLPVKPGKKVRLKMEILRITIELPDNYSVPTDLIPADPGVHAIDEIAQRIADMLEISVENISAMWERK